MIKSLDDKQARRFVPDEQEGLKKGRTIFREALHGEENDSARYEISKRYLSATVELDLDDPIAAALMFREFRRISGADVEGLRVHVTCELSSLTERSLEALEAFSDLAFSAISFRNVRVDSVYYRELESEKLPPHAEVRAGGAAS